MKIRKKPELRKFSNLRRLEGSGIEDTSLESYQERELPQYFGHNLTSTSGVPALPFPNLFRLTQSNFLDSIY